VHLSNHVVHYLWIIRSALKCFEKAIVIICTKLSHCGTHSVLSGLFLAAVYKFSYLLTYLLTYLHIYSYCVQS